MSDQTGTLTQEVIDRLNVVALPGASSLKEAELLLEVTYSVRMLQDRTPFTSQVVQPPSSPYASVIVETDGGHTLFIGLGLEVIQAMQKHEKK